MFRPLKTVTAPASHILACEALSHLSAAVASGVTCSVKGQSHRFLLLLQFITMVWESHEVWAVLSYNYYYYLILFNNYMTIAHTTNIHWMFTTHQAELMLYLY